MCSRSFQTAQAMSSEIDEPDPESLLIDEPRGDLRDQHLAAVAPHDPCRTVDGRPEVTAVAFDVAPVWSPRIWLCSLMEFGQGSVLSALCASMAAWTASAGLSDDV